MVYNDKNNVYALNLKGDVIHASEANSGRQGYYCLGCKKEMQAVRSKKSNRIDYFRHDPKNVVSGSKCTYSDETYRHKLAKEILQRIKRIKVPAVYKYPPKGQEGLANLLVESKYIEAATVGIEMTFYEDESGAIHFGSNKDIESRFLIVRPDITFFNGKSEPILFIEIVVTHGIKNDKLIKLKRLGIDTVQVRIPKDSPESIEKSFHVTDKIKWIYNNVEERTEYVPTTSSNSKGVSPIDELQRKLQEESLACRTAEIGNLIRSIKRCLESKPYRESEDELREEISRVTRNTDTHRARLDKIREDCRSGVERIYTKENEAIRERRKRLEREEEALEQKHRDLESRYFKKAREIAAEDKELELRIQKEIEGSTGTGETIEHRKRKIDRDRELERRDFETRGNANRKVKEAILRDIEGERLGIKQIIDSRNTIPAKFKQLEESIRGEFKKQEDREREEEQRLKTEEEGIRREFEELRDRATNSTKTRVGDGTNELSRGINQLIQNWERLRDFEKFQLTYKRHREAWESFNKGTYKNWTD